MVRIAVRAWLDEKRRNTGMTPKRGERRVWRGVGVRGWGDRAQSREALAVKREFFLSVERPKRQICGW
jgi:hypothetical protein